MSVISGVDVERLAQAGVVWHSNGQVSLRDPARSLAVALDATFVALAATWHADAEDHPSFLPASAVERVGYFSSFPHLVTFPVSLDAGGGAGGGAGASDDRLAAFAAGDHLDESGAVRLSLGQLAPVRDVLTPAACYHVFAGHAGQRLEGGLYVTTRNTCFRREADYAPLRRQSAFQMREVVGLGARDDVDQLLERCHAWGSAFATALGLDTEWLHATDPFFQPQSNPHYVLQKVHPTKRELTTPDGLALASLNLHHDHFGVLFDIRRSGEPITSGCVAFGIERWVGAVIARFGPDAERWPDVQSAGVAAQPGLERR